MLPLISIVIPVKNGAAWIRQSIEGIMEQTLFSECEILVVDSGSTDETLDMLKKYPVQVLSIPAAEFNHGATRNKAAAHANGKYVVMTVQDARPADNKWLEKLLAGFSEADVAGVCGAQVVPHEPDKNPVDWYRPVSEPKQRIVKFLPGEFLKLSPAAQSEFCRWDDVNAMYLRQVLIEHPFETVSYGEDMLWAKNALTKGFTLVYEPAAIVYHYHHENENFLLKRFFISWYFRFKYFGVMPAQAKFTLKKKLSILKLLFTKYSSSIKKKIYWWKYNKTRWGVREKAFQLFVAAKNNNELGALYEQYCTTPPQHEKQTGK